MSERRGFGSLQVRGHGRSPSQWDTAGLGTADRTVGSRVGASVVALTWAFFFFGIIDFPVAIIPSEFPDFMPFVVLETSWGSCTRSCFRCP